MIFRRFLIIIPFLFFRNKFYAYSCPFCSKAILFCSQQVSSPCSCRNAFPVEFVRFWQRKKRLWQSCQNRFPSMHYSSVISSTISDSVSSTDSSEGMVSSSGSVSAEISSLKLISSSPEISRISSVLKCVER